MALKPWFRTPQETFEDQEICFKRSEKHWNEIQSVFPDLNGDYTIDSDNIGKTLIRVFVYCPANVSEKDTRTITKWMNRYFGNVERNFRKDQGRFYWLSKVKKEDENGEYEFLFFIENTHPLTCEVKKVIKEVEVFESICK